MAQVFRYVGFGLYLLNFGGLAIGCRKQGNWSRTDAFCAIGAIICSRLPIPGSARARRTVAQKRVEELGLSVPGNFPDVGLSGRMSQLLSPVREQHVGIGGEALECPGEFMILPGK